MDDVWNQCFGMTCRTNLLPGADRRLGTYPLPAFSSKVKLSMRFKLQLLGALISAGSSGIDTQLESSASRKSCSEPRRDEPSASCEQKHQTWQAQSKQSSMPLGAWFPFGFCLKPAQKVKTLF